jgi:hypothetical protein
MRCCWRIGSAGHPTQGDRDQGMGTQRKQGWVCLCRHWRWWFRVGIRICIWRGRRLWALRLGLALLANWADAGRCGWRGLRQGGQAAWAGVSGRAVDRSSGAVWRSEGCAVQLCADQDKAHLEGKAPRTKGAKTAPIAELDRHFLFSFSGIKTAVLRYVEVHGLRAELRGPAARADGNGAAYVAGRARLCAISRRWI